VAEFGLLCLALAAGASAAGVWCGIAGLPEAGVLAAVGLGLDAERALLVPDPGPAWPRRWWRRCWTAVRSSWFAHPRRPQPRYASASRRRCGAAGASCS